MAWFGDIKNITGSLTGQLSNVANTAASFTRDVLAEGTEEVSDQGTELKIAQRKIKELEGLVVGYRSESERLKELNHELTDKAESSELQINAISQQYRGILQEKQHELVALKQQQQTMQDMQHSMLATAATATTTTESPTLPSMTHSTSTSSLSNSQLASDEHDFGDVISSQHEINRLSNEVSRLRTECEHWRQLAGAGPQGDQAGPQQQNGSQMITNDEVLQLKAKIKELEHSLSREIDESQRELSALQDTHSQKQATLGKRHKYEIEDYTQRIEQLEQLLQSGETPPTSPPVTPVHNVGSEGTTDQQPAVKELQDALKKSQHSFNQVDESCRRLRVELEQVKQVEGKKSKTAEILRKQVEAVKLEKEKLMQENETFRYVKRDLASKLDAERQENARLMQECDKAKGYVDNGKSEIERIRAEEVIPLSEKLKRTEEELEAFRAERDQASTSCTRQELHQARTKFTSGALSRQTQLLKEKQELVNKMIDVGEKVTEGTASIALLKAANSEISDETEDMVSAIGRQSRADEDITPDLVQALEEENLHLQQKVNHLETDVRQLNEKCASLAQDKETSEGIISKFNHDVMMRLTLNQSSGCSVSASEGTLDFSGDSETESTARLNDSQEPVENATRIPVGRPKSSSTTSTESDRTTRTESERTTSSGLTPPRVYTDDSDMPDSQSGAMGESSDVSFDGEYDDSIIFSGMKQRFPEAAHVFQEQIEHFELIRTDWDMEKQALEEVVIRMREQLKEKDSQIQKLTSHEGLIEIDSREAEQLEEDLETLQDRVEEIEEEEHKLQQEKDALVQKHNILQQEFECLQDTSVSLSKENDTLKSNLHEADDTAKHHMAKAEDLKKELHLLKEATLSESTNKHHQLEADIKLLNQQHQEVLNDILQSRDEFKTELHQCKTERDNIMISIRENESHQNELKQLGRKQDAEMADLRGELDQKNALLTELKNSQQDKDREVLNLQDELHKMRMLREEFERSNTELSLLERDKVDILEEENKQLKEQHTVNVDVKEQLEKSLMNLKDQLQKAVELNQNDESRTDELEGRICELESTVDDLNTTKDKLNSDYKSLKEKLQTQLSLNEEQSNLLTNYEQKIDFLAKDKEAVRLLLQQKQIEYERTIQELSHYRELDTSALHAEHDKLIQLKNAKETEVLKLKSEYDELQADLSGTKDILNSTLDNHQQLADILENKEEDIKHLAEENLHFLQAIERSKMKEKEFGDMQDQLQATEIQLQEAKSNNATISLEVKKLKEDLKERLERSDVETKTLEVITELEEEVRDLQRVLDDKEGETSSLQVVVKQKQKDIDRLEEISKQKSKELEESQTRVVSLEFEMSSLKSELDEKNASETAAEAHSAWILERDAQILNLGKKLSDLREQIQHQEKTFAANLEEKNTELSLMRGKLEKLRQELDFRQKNAGEIKAEHNFVLNQKDTQIVQLTERIEQLTKAASGQNDNRSCEENGIIEEEVVFTNVPELQTESMHGQPVMNRIAESSISDNEKHLENTVQDMKKEIALLKESNLSLVSLLEDKSQTAIGSTMLVDLHKLQMQVRSFESERSQMISVLNEKTRECSNFKNEVHQLVAVVSAQKTALEKAQQDNRDIQHHVDEPRNDMQKQALQNLSRLIQDKDLEIEAMKQKTDTLLQVLQSTEPNSSSDISRVLGDSAQLQKENKVMKEERDQLIVSIHQKHQESLTYYEEVQRLVGVVNEESHKGAELLQKYTTISDNLNDNERSLSQLNIDIEAKDLSIAKLHQQLEQRNQSVLDLEHQLSELNDSIAQINKQSHDVSTSDSQELENVKSLLRTKDNDITDLKSRIESLSRITATPDTSAVNASVIKDETSLVQSAPPLNNNSFEAKEVEITNLQEQLSLHAKTLSSKDSAISAKQEELQRKHVELASLKQEIDMQNQTILARDAALQLKSHQLQTLTDGVKSKDLELRSLHSQNQTLHIQLQGFQSENENLKKDGQSLQHAVHNKDGENRSLQDMSNRLAAQLREKDFELGALKEKNQTLTSLVKEREFGTAGELQRLLGETEAMQKQAQMFQQERDQVLLALQRHQADIQALQTEVSTSRERENRLVRELERLRGHLLQVEEGYTRDALESEEREQELRSRLSQAEDAARSSSSAVHSASKESSSHIESLLDQLHSVTNQKDQALLLLGEAQEQVQQYSTSLANLQMVLEQFTQEKEASIAADIEHFKMRAEEKAKVAEQLFKEKVILQEQLATTKGALEAASRLSEQLNRKEEVAVKLREEMARKEDLLHEYEVRFHEIGNTSDNKVDKPLIKNLVLGYFNAPPNKRPEVLKLIGSVLNFELEELQKIGAEGSQGRWFSGLWGRGTPTNTPPSTPNKTLEKSFSQQFVKFLEYESTPTPKVRLPLEEMTSDTPRSPRSTSSGTFNPFSAPVPQFSPFIQHHTPMRTTSGGVKPVLAPTGPMFAPIIVPDLKHSTAGSVKATDLRDILQE